MSPRGGKLVGKVQQWLSSLGKGAEPDPKSHGSLSSVFQADTGESPPRPVATAALERLTGGGDTAGLRESELVKDSRYQPAIEPWLEPTSSALASDGSFKLSSFPILPIGAWKIQDGEHGPHGRELAQLRPVDPWAIDFGEQSSIDKEVVKACITWMRSGRPVPPIQAAEGSGSGLSLTSGAVWLQAARAIGRPLDAWVTPLQPSGSVTDSVMAATKQVPLTWGYVEKTRAKGGTSPLAESAPPSYSAPVRPSAGTKPPTDDLDAKMLPPGTVVINQQQQETLKKTMRETVTGEHTGATGTEPPQPQSTAADATRPDALIPDVLSLPSAIADGTHPPVTIPTQSVTTDAEAPSAPDSGTASQVVMTKPTEAILFPKTQKMLARLLNVSPRRLFASLGVPGIHTGGDSGTNDSGIVRGSHEPVRLAGGGVIGALVGILKKPIMRIVARAAKTRAGKAIAGAAVKSGGVARRVRASRAGRAASWAMKQVRRHGASGASRPSYRQRVEGWLAKTKPVRRVAARRAQKRFDALPPEERIPPPLSASERMTAGMSGGAPAIEAAQRQKTEQADKKRVDALRKEEEKKLAHTLTKLPIPGLKLVGVIAGATIAMRKFAERLNVSNFALAKYNGQIAALSARATVHTIHRDIDIARRTQGTSTNLANAVEEMRDAFQPLSVRLRNVTNTMAVWGSKFATSVANLTDAVMQIYDKIAFWQEKQDKEKKDNQLPAARDLMRYIATGEARKRLDKLHGKRQALGPIK